MKRFILLILIFISLSFSVFSMNYNCNGDINLNNISNSNNISISKTCYALRFEYNSNISNSNFDIYDNGFQNKVPFLIYDNTPSSNYNNSNYGTYNFNFKNFSNVYFKYGSDNKIVTKDYINRNKFIGTPTTDATIEISNTIIGGQKYFVSGSFNKFRNVYMYFENFGTTNSIGEYRVFLNDILNVNVYVDTSGLGTNEKILIIKKNVGIININNLLKNSKGFKDSRINIITYQEFLNGGIDKIYMKNPTEIKSKIIDAKLVNPKSFTDKLIKQFNENKTPLSVYLFGIFVIMLISYLSIGSQKVIVKSNKNFYLHFLYAFIPSIILLFITKNLIATFVISLIISTIVFFIYYKDYVNEKNIIKFIKYFVFVFVMTIIFSITYYYLWGLK